MTHRTLLGALLIVGIGVGCGPRLRHEADAPKAAAAVDVPVAKMSVQLDPAKLDEAHKYKEGGKFTVSGLFYKDGEPQDATVNVTPFTADGKVSHGYEVDLTNLAGANAKVEMWDDGFLTVVIPPSPDTPPQFATSNTSIKAVDVPVPGGHGESHTCYFGKEVLDGQLRLALCDLQTPQPKLAFVDGENVPAAPPAAETAPAAPTPADTAPTGAAPKAN